MGEGTTEEEGQSHRLRDYPTFIRQEEQPENSCLAGLVSLSLLISSNKTRVEASELLDHSSTQKIMKSLEHKHTCVC
jgi:hypothetical protein